MPDPAAGRTPEPHWASMREAGSPWQLRLMRLLALRVPDAALQPLLWCIALAFAANRSRPATEASGRYLSRVLGRTAGLAERHRHALTFARVIVDRVRLLAHGAGGFRIASRGERLVRDLVEAGRGGVLLGAHFGSFEAMRAYDRLLPGLRVHYLMHPDHARHTHALLGDLNPAVAARVIPLANGPAAMIAVFEALDNGEFVAFLGDRLPDPAPRSRTSVRFLGAPIDVPASPYIAAMTAGVPLILCLAPRLGRDRYEIEFSLLHDGAPVPRHERDAAVARMAARYVGRLEEICRRHPYNWFNFYDIWRRADGVPETASSRRGRGAGRASARG